MSRDTVISGAWELGRQASPEHPPSIPRASPEHPRSLPMGARIHRNKTNKPTGEGARNENGGHWVSHVSPVARGVAKGVARGVARGAARATARAAARGAAGRWGDRLLLPIAALGLSFEYNK